MASITIDVNLFTSDRRQRINATGDNRRAAMARDAVETGAHPRSSGGQFTSSHGSFSSTKADPHPKHFEEAGKARAHQHVDPKTGAKLSSHGPFGNKQNAHAYAKGLGIKGAVRSRPAGFTVEE